jgi:hypothetical protein
MPFEGPVRVQIDDNEQLLPHSVAQLVRVETEGEPLPANPVGT